MVLSWRVRVMVCSAEASHPLKGVHQAPLAPEVQRIPQAAGARGGAAGGTAGAAGSSSCEFTLDTDRQMDKDAACE